MNLVWFEVEGYKRFCAKSKINLDGKLVAIVGPNEAGKTSLLHCLRHFSDDSAFVQQGSAQELTRRKQMASTDVVAEWTFALDASDHAELSDIQGSEDVRWYVVTKKVDGEYTHDIKPRPQLTLSRRVKTIDAIRAYIESQRPSESDDRGNDGGHDNTHFDLCQEVISGLSSESEKLPNSLLKSIEQLAEQLAEENNNLNQTVLTEQLTSLHSLESLQPPTTRIMEHLWKSRPHILLFDASDRDLLSEYNIQGYFFEDRKRGIRKKPIPTALQNLCAASGLDLQALHTAQKNDDRGKVRTLLEAAEDTINDLLRDAWTQSRLSLSLELDSFRLQVLLKSQGGDYVKVIERSEGLRQFLALLLFLSKRATSKTRPIVLIDEAEIHLHYDAQADLVQTLAKQHLASKVIYTTHSVGCLPEDLGSGIRMVATDDPYSIVENWFWQSERPGFSPLLFAMGARTLAFMPMRYSVVGEGAADMILVPAILKQVLEVDSIGFQIVPGLSSQTNEQIGIIDSESTRTIYLVDGDSAGRAIRAKILKAGVDQSRIVDLPMLNGQETVLEDYISADVYLRCVNVDLEMSGCPAIPDNKLSGSNRPKQLESWCEQHNCSIPSKRSVAYRVVDEKNEHNIVEKSAVEAVKTLYSKLLAALQLENDTP
ncbi:AAA family ATPase [filamentous cyanobacterium LEGE 11480]|uniref:AAA family ATPase n=1 Tax=Romeriopsis navalis LEGE 11480 TaxID=2777977 RepID=A0A928Z2P3_9CYAN|nr:AAA family ATPase [Romeriopsis navalis]MBE9028580.1 AAA family ATPase [Romeriopsis navalis LEGE 11480]